MPQNFNYINKYNTAEFKLTRPVNKRKVLAEKSINRDDKENNVLDDTIQGSAVDVSECMLGEIAASPERKVVFINRNDLVEIQGVDSRRYGCIRKLNFSRE
ncbi:hypothetical protein THOM_2098 [Trachipleistophora hominis]|uniref:Uncharacterized protein n=1 Tax=Trachipleistophora hominis TaxID=72359 RepID=L7JUH3_TRAHO|nr:hypothetical protein THOM_2098 [Trachipleistophora hominis]